MFKVLAVVGMMAVAQLIPSCGGDDRNRPGDSDSGPARPQVIGWVMEKRHRMQETEPYSLVIDNIEYGVPVDFYRATNIGDLVKFDGMIWTLVRRR